MKSVNDIELRMFGKDTLDELKVTALSTEAWNKDDLLYFDTSDNVVKKITANTAAVRVKFCGIAAADKLEGETVGSVRLRARLYVKLTSATASNILGAKVTYTYASGEYSFAVATNDTVGHIVQNSITINGYGLIEINVLNQTNFFARPTASV